MKSQLNTLRQLQELVLTRDEHIQNGDGRSLDKLNESIQALQAELNPQVSAVYQRLYKKSHIVISAMTNNGCAVCGMKVPISQVQQVCLARHLVTCSSCGRILFADDPEAARNVTEAVREESPRTGVSRFSAEELMVADLGDVDRVGAIEKLARAMEEGGFIKNSERLVTSALERENVISTAMGEGLAFPHVRGVEGGALTFALGVSKKGIDWDGENTVNIVVLSAIPVAVSAFYIRLVSGLVQSLTKEANKAAILAAGDSTALWKALSKATRAAVK